MIMNNTLRILREQNNYSQAAVASYLGISRQMYIKYETGAAIPPVKVVTDLSNFYRVPYDVIIEDKLNQSKNNKLENSKSSKYPHQRSEDIIWELHEPDAIYSPQETSSSYYLKAILEMLPKLVYKEQLKVLEKVSGMVQTATEEKLKPNKQMNNYIKLSKYASSLHLKSDGKKWTREELYERQ